MAPLRPARPAADRLVPGPDPILAPGFSAGGDAPPSSRDLADGMLQAMAPASDSLLGKALRSQGSSIGRPRGFTDCCQLTTPTTKGRVVSRSAGESRTLGDPVGIGIEPFPCIVGKKESAEERAKLAALSRIDP